MFGDDLLVSPVTEPGIEMWTVYLPGQNQVAAEQGGDVINDFN